MKKKMISSILIYSMFVQILVSHPGCTSFYSTFEHDRLSNYYNYEDKILLKMKNESEIYIIPKNSIFVDKPTESIFAIGEEYDYKIKRGRFFKGIIEKDKIDSIKIVEGKSIPYHIFWLNDNRRINIKSEKVLNMTPDSGSGFWLVVDNDKDVFRKIYDTDIEEIQVEKTNWITTSLVIAGGIVLLTPIIILAIIGETPSFTGFDGF